MICQAKSFVRRYKKLTDQQKYRVDNSIIRFGEAIGRPHQHGGIGIRLIGRYVEFRAGIDVRVLALPYQGDYVLVFVGTHDQVNAYIRNG
jgi:hypothetical protein